MGEAKRKVAIRAETLASIDKVSINLTMGFDEMQAFIAQQMAMALYRAKLPWLPGEKIVVGDLERAAAFLMGALAGADAEVAKQTKKEN